MNRKIFKASTLLFFAVFSFCTSKTGEDRFNRAKKLYYEGLYDRAKVVLDSSLMSEELSENEKVQALILSADIDIKLGEYLSSSAALEELYSLKKDMKDTVILRYTQIIDKLSYEGRFSEEVFFSKKAFLIDQNAVGKQALAEITRSFLLENDTANALNALSRSLKYEDLSLNACMLLSSIYKNRKMFEISVSWLDSALIKPNADKIQIMQEKADLLVEMSRELIEKGRQGEAIGYLSEASYLTQGTTSAEAAWLAGSLYVASENYAKGRIYLERVLEIERSSVIREKAIKLLQMI
ncbi:hypothetical protein JW890_00725 [candidate division WOR-3 bacterium]|nr:hypothetical protein [candidate division WOR-3 bacterium]